MNLAFVNPVLNGDYPDPAVCRVGEDFYLTASTGHQYPGLTIYHSTNLVDWEFLCNPLRNFPGDVWAPDIVFHEGKFYIYFCASGSNWVIYSERIDGGWSEAIDLKVGKIDPGHCVDDEGKRYLFLSGGFIVPLADDGLSVTGDMQQVMYPQTIPDAWDVEGFFPESPKITKHNGWYYMTYANGGTSGPATAHMVACARARHPTGPWEYSPYYPILRTENRSEHWHCRGHGHIVDDMAGNWWILYHAYEKGYWCHGRKLLLERLIWTEDGWYHTDPKGNAEGNAVLPAGKQMNNNIHLCDDFNSGNCGIWKAYGDVSCTRYRTDQDGLVLDGIGVNPGECLPLTVTCGLHSYLADTFVRPESGCEAGIILLYDDRYYNGIGFDGETLTVYRIGQVLTKMPLKSEAVYLRMENRENYVVFYYSVDGEHFRRLNFVIDTEPQNTNAYGGFRALRPGVYAYGAEQTQAHFAYFKVTEL